MDFKEQLKSSVDIVRVVQEYLPLRKSGANRYTGLCPFHSEKTPSFSVHAAKQIFYCFGCHEGGDVLSFVMKIEGISFYEALKSLAERHGIPMPKRSLVADEQTRLREAVFRMHELAQENFRANLHSPAGELARNYLARRGVARETIERFGLGYADRSGRAVLRLLEQNGFPAPQIPESGLVGKREDGSLYDRFRHRLMFPIHSETGKIIGYGGRALADDDNPKYLNSPETPIYKKSYVLYNLNRAKEAIRKEDRVILVEGYMDAIGVTAAGFGPVVASCGTALTAQQVQMVKRQTQRIVVNFDPDAPGANAAERSINLLLEEGMQVRIMDLDGELDPDEYCKERGAEAYRERLDHAKGYFYWLADRARARYDVHTTEGVVAILKFLMPAVERISDRLERLAVANDVAGYIGVSSGVVLDSFRKAVADRQEKVLVRPAVVLRADERLLLNALLGESEMGDEIVEELKSIGTIEKLPSHRIFQAIFALGASGGRVDFQEVHARLEPADQSLLAEAILGAPLGPSMGDAAPISEADIRAALDSLRRSETQQRREDLKLRIKQSERAGQWEEALRLTSELQAIERAARR